MKLWAINSLVLLVGIFIGLIPLSTYLDSFKTEIKNEIFHGNLEINKSIKLLSTLGVTSVDQKDNNNCTNIDMKKISIVIDDVFDRNLLIFWNMLQKANQNDQGEPREAGDYFTKLRNVENEKKPTTEIRTQLFANNIIGHPRILSNEEMKLFVAKIQDEQAENERIVGSNHNEEIVKKAIKFIEENIEPEDPIRGNIFREIFAEIDADPKDQK